VTDDIVTRLRKQAVCTRSECDDCDLHRNAADEIERLQAEVKTWMEIAHDLFNTHGHDWLHYEEHMCGEVTNGCGGYLCECGYPWSMKSGCAAAEALRRYEEVSRD